MKNPVIKSKVFWMLILSIMALGASYGLEYIFQLNPCPLCMMQRFSTLMIAIWSLVYFVTKPWSKRLSFWIILWVFVGLGLSSALRQLWLQWFVVSDSSLCMPGFEELMMFFSWTTVIKMMFWGSNDCSTISWTFMGMPMSAWSLVYFLMVLSLSLHERLVSRS